MKTTSLLLLLLLTVAGSHGRKAHARLQKSNEVAVPEEEARQAFPCDGECYGFFGEYGYKEWQCGVYFYPYYHVQTGCNCCVDFIEYHTSYKCSGQCIGFDGYYGYLSFQCDQFQDYYYDASTGCYCCVPQYFPQYS